MPINYSKYPPKWKTEIRPAILKRAENCCEECGVKNYSRGVRQLDGTFTEIPIYPEKMLNEEQFEFQKMWAEMNGFKVIKIVLTIAHLDHDINNNDYSNLKAFCQKCHLSYDKEHHLKNSRETRNNKKGLQELF